MESTTMFAFDSTDKFEDCKAPHACDSGKDQKPACEDSKTAEAAESTIAANLEATGSQNDLELSIVNLDHKSDSGSRDSVARTPPVTIMTKSILAQSGRSSPVMAPFTVSNAVQLPIKLSRKERRAQKKRPSLAFDAIRNSTPLTSADEDSDFSPRIGRSRSIVHTPRSTSVARKDIHIADLKPDNGISRSSSPSAISALTRQIDDLRSRSPSLRPTTLRKQSTLTSSETPSSASVTSDTDADDYATQMTSYEVNLEHDFISSDMTGKGVNIDAEKDSVLNDGVVRKMQATDFEPLRCLGKGTYGTVLLVKQHATGRLFAQKQFRKASLTVRKHLVEQTKTERSILESINRHPFVVKLFYAFQDHEKLYLILEYAQGGELFERMRNERMFPEETAAFYMAELVLALDHLHRTVGVVYRDLKPENCLLDSEGHLLLTDFGLSKVAVDGDYKCRSMTGTVEYMAPEVIQMLEYDTAVDWWSLGILGFDLLTGSSPFQANNDMKIKEKILRSKLVLPYFLSKDAKDLLVRLLRKEPKRRLGANMPKDMQTIKSHRFFKKIDWAKLARREVDPPIKPLITDPELAENFSTEFTDLAVSPVRASMWSTAGKGSEHDPFGGFSFVGSRSLLESDAGFL